MNATTMRLGVALAPAALLLAGTAASGAPVESQPRARAVGIDVRGVKVEEQGRHVQASLRWVAALIARPGHHERFNVRLLTMNKRADGSGSRVTELFSDTDRRAGRLGGNLRIRLGAKKASVLRSADTVLLSVSQQYDSPRDRDRKHEVNFVTTVDITPRVARAAQSAQAVGRTDDNPYCIGVKITPGADLSGCNLSGARLSGADLSGVNLSDAHLGGADLSAANLSKANLARADLSSSSLLGADLRNANLRGADLLIAYVRETLLDGADLSGAQWGGGAFDTEFGTCLEGSIGRCILPDQE